MKNGLLTLTCLSALLTFSSARAQTPAAAPAAPAPAAPTPAASAPVAPDAPPSIDPAKVAEIRNLLELSGTVKMLQPVVGNLINAFRAKNTDIAPAFWDNYEKQIDMQGLVEKMVPIYDKYFTLDDLKTINAFYQTPAGKRMIAATPMVARDGMQVGQAWGQEVAMKLNDDITKERQKEASAATPTAAAASAAASAIAPAATAAPAAPAPAAAPAPMTPPTAQ